MGSREPESAVRNCDVVGGAEDGRAVERADRVLRIARGTDEAIKRLNRRAEVLMVLAPALLGGMSLYLQLYGTLFACLVAVSTSVGVVVRQRADNLKLPARLAKWRVVEAVCVPGRELSPRDVERLAVREMPDAEAVGASLPASSVSEYFSDAVSGWAGGGCSEVYLQSCFWSWQLARTYSVVLCVAALVTAIVGGAVLGGIIGAETESVAGVIAQLVASFAWGAVAIQLGGKAWHQHCASVTLRAIFQDMKEWLGGERGSREFDVCLMRYQLARMGMRDAPTWLYRLRLFALRRRWEKTRFGLMAGSTASGDR